MFNPFVIKKNLALVLVPVLCTFVFFIGMNYYDLWVALVMYAGMLIIGVVMGGVLLDNPFRKIVEGEGLMLLDVNSTGLLGIYLVNVDHPYIKGVVRGRQIEEHYDRDTSYNINAPTIMKNKAHFYKDDSGEKHISFDFKESEYNSNKFALWSYPVILWNSQLNTVINKEFISGQEKTTFSENQLLYLNRKIDEQTSMLREFGRGIVDTLRPKQNFFNSKLIMIIMMVGLGLLLIVLAPKIIQVVQGFIGSGTLSNTLTPDINVNPLP